MDLVKLHQINKFHEFKEEIRGNARNKVYALKSKVKQVFALIIISNLVQNGGKL